MNDTKEIASQAFTAVFELLGTEHDIDAVTAARIGLAVNDLVVKMLNEVEGGE